MILRVLVTGSNSGIGLATALTLAKAGHHVYATVRNTDRAGALLDAVEKENLPLSILELDVLSDRSVANAFSTIHSKGESVDVLINNAGIERMGAVEELSLEDFRQTMETNYFGALRCIQACLPAMRRRKSGWIVNVSSVASHIPLSPLTPYLASKAALDAMSEALAQELKSFNIRVAIVQPGIVDTPMARRIEDESVQSEYVQGKRCADLFSIALANQPSPSIIAEEIRRIIESNTWQLRHPVGPDAMALLGWRQDMSAEEWVSLGALDEAGWKQHIQSVFGPAS
jgi:NAD(P)-dependent dehydrogenase (short-subunit alcohol dehydrogenase family)